MTSPPKSNAVGWQRNRNSVDAPTLNLCVRGLHPETTNYDLISVFKQFGALDAMTSYHPRTSALVMFNNLEDSKDAKKALEGTLIKGSKIKIKFSRLVKPGKHVYIGGISLSVMEEQLKSKLRQFGKIEEFKFLRDRNSAMVRYSNLDDAIAAQKSLDGKILGGQQVRVDFLEPHYLTPQSSKQNASDVSLSGGKKLDPQEGKLGHNKLTNHVSNKNQPHRGHDGPPCNTLWVSYPPSMFIDRTMLHNAMILFGEIEAIRIVRTKNFCFVEFRSVDEATRAKEGLEGRLFGDPRIRIQFAASALTQKRDDAPILPEYRGSRPRTTKHIESPSGHMESIVPTYPPCFGRQSVHENDTLSILGARPYTVPSSWDDAIEARKSKKLRIDESPQNDIPPYESSQSPIVRGSVRSPISDIWYGVLAKGGSFVCHARCLPVGNGFESPLPEIVNCSARTDLGKLTTQCKEASGFDTVFFYPASEKDFGPYTEFLRYLKGNNRVGVAECANGTPLFLVPPSEFLTNILKVTGPERLYGVVFKSLHQSIQEVHHPHNVEQREHTIDHFRHVNGKLDSRSMISSDKHNYPISMASAPYASASNSAEPLLTPEILSSLSSLLPLNNKSSAALNRNMSLSPSTSLSALNANGILEHPTYAAFQLNPIATNTAIHPQHSDNQCNIQASTMPQYPTYDSSAQPQNPTLNTRQHFSTSTMHFGNYDTAQEQTFTINQHSQYHVTSYNPYSSNSLAGGQSITMLQNQVASSANYSSPIQNGQMGLKIDSCDDEKKLKYQQTLNLAATMLQQLRQEKQSGSSGHQQ